MVVDLGKCGCENCSCKEARDHNTCDECHESHRETIIEKFAKIAFTMIFFWHILLLNILAEKKVEKEIAKHPDLLMKAFLEEMSNGT
jgi:hypothetical protein